MNEKKKKLEKILSTREIGLLPKPLKPMKEKMTKKKITKILDVLQKPK